MSMGMRPLSKVRPGEFGETMLAAVLLHEPPPKQWFLCHVDGLASVVASAAAAAAAAAVEADHAAAWLWPLMIQTSNQATCHQY